MKSAYQGRTPFVSKLYLIIGILIVAALLGGCRKTLPQLCAEGCGKSHDEEALPETQSADNNDLRIHFIPVGAGLCSLIECPDSKDVVLFDCGSTYDLLIPKVTYDYARDYIEQVLKARDGGNLRVMVSHADFDHVSLVEYVTNGIKIKEAYVPDPNRASLFTRAEAIEIVKYLRTKADKTEGPADRILMNINSQPRKMEGFCGSAEVYMLAAEVGDPINNQSMVIYLKYKDFSAILPGDAQGRDKGSTEDVALSNLKKIKVDNKPVTLLQASHHGASSHGSNSIDWSKGTSPLVTVFSSGQLYTHPYCQSACRFYNTSLPLKEGFNHNFECGKNFLPPRANITMDRALYETHLDGYIKVSSNGADFSVQCKKELRNGKFESCGVDNYLLSNKYIPEASCIAK